MTDNEKLIEEAATAMWADPEQWATITEPVRDDFRGMARSALAVFEKAHTPTDDEREALARVAAKIERVPDSDAVTIDKADARILVAAGFCRPEVPEPSALTICECYRDGSEMVTCESHTEPQGEPPSSENAYTGIPLSEVIRSEQGETSDAQTLVVAHDELCGCVLDDCEFKQGWRAALRAAGGVR